MILNFECDFFSPKVWQGYQLSFYPLYHQNQLSQTLEFLDYINKYFGLVNGIFWGATKNLSKRVTLCKYSVPVKDVATAEYYLKWYYQRVGENAKSGITIPVFHIAPEFFKADFLEPIKDYLVYRYVCTVDQLMQQILTNTKNTITTNQ